MKQDSIVRNHSKFLQGFFSRMKACGCACWFAFACAVLLLLAAAFAVGVGCAGAEKVACSFQLYNLLLPLALIDSRET